MKSSQTYRSPGLQGGIPWFKKQTRLFVCPLCKSGTEDFLLGGLNIPFPKVIRDTVGNYAAVSVSKMIKVRSDKLKNRAHLHGGTGRS